MSAVLALTLAVPLLLLAGCRAAPALAHARPSDEDAARAVLEAIAGKDLEALLQLAVSREEFERLVWPTLPASRAEVGMPVGYVWQDTFTKSQAHLARALRRWGGRRLSLVRLEFAGETTDAGAYSVSRKTRLVVRDEAGAELTVRLFGSIIRQDGQSKIFSYIVD